MNENQWVDLTDDEEYQLAKRSAGKSRHWLVASAIDAFKKKNEPIKVEWNGIIDPKDFRIDTFSNRRGGFVLGISSVVRVTHIPTGFVEECDEDRSQHRNRHTAFERLKQRLLVEYKQKFLDF